MTLTIKIPPDVESALKARALRLGVPVERYAAGVLRRDVESNGAPYEAARSASPSSRLRGMLSHLPGTVDEFLLERHQEAQRELDKDAA